MTQPLEPGAAMGDDDSLEAAYDRLAKTLEIKQGFEYRLIDGIGCDPGEHLHEFADRIVREWQAKDRELDAWRSGRRRRSWPVVESVPDAISTAAALARASHDDEGDHGDLMRSAAQSLATLSRAAAVLLADRDRERSSRQAWAEEAVRLKSELDSRRVELAIALHAAQDLPWDELLTEAEHVSRPVCAVHPEGGETA